MNRPFLDTMRWLHRQLNRERVSSDEILWLLTGCPDTGETWLDTGRARYLADLLGGFARHPDCPHPVLVMVLHGVIAGIVEDVEAEAEQQAAEDEAHERDRAADEAYVDHLRRQ